MINYALKTRRILKMILFIFDTKQSNRKEKIGINILLNKFNEEFLAFLISINICRGQVKFHK